MSTGSSSSSSLLMLHAVLGVCFLQTLYWVAQQAYNIRLYAINEYGRVIHEFDPYFNYRATEYLYENGWKAFSKWFDYKVWYPLGRPVGTTIYPGMQVTAVFLKNHLLTNWSINDICVFIPAWFGVAATLAVAWLTYECTRHQASQGSVLSEFPLIREVYKYIVLPLVRLVLDLLEKIVPSSSAWGLRPPSRSDQYNVFAPLASALSAAFIMSVIPAHLLRSIGGGYDNESVAMTAMVLTFCCWTFSLREDWNNLYVTFALGLVAGLAYFYMVAAWGGYVFVVNMVAAHAGWLVLTGRYSQRLHRAYTAFYILGTALATTVPVVGWTPLRSMEQMVPLIGFVGLQLIEFVEIQKRKYKWGAVQTWKARITIFLVTGVVAAVLAYLLLGQGYFGPISSRVRGLFVKHTKTGNPLVDSVAEHQAASEQAYFQYLHHVVTVLPYGLAMTLLFGYNDSSSFLLVYGVASYYFSLKMVRLILLTAPIASILGGIAVGRLFSWGVLSALFSWTDAELPVEKKGSKKNKPNGKSLKKDKKNDSSEKSDDKAGPSGNSETFSFKQSIMPWVLRGMRVAAAVYMIRLGKPYVEAFYQRSHEVAKSISHPTIIQKARTRDGDIVIVDDYREAYKWLAENTPEDARIMAWWDYGYQITGIGNRTTIADGNTWNHEHIALLGRILTAPEKEAHRIARHLADYVLLWAGGGGDDLAKSPHLRRIANSVYRGLCKEPTCREFGFYSNRVPTDNMRDSLLYTLHSNGINPGVVVDRNRFREVFTSKYGKVRIYKIQSVSEESKQWVLNNRVCDAPGSWFCPGQYPPALEEILSQKRDFAQLEDFNRKTEADDEYTKEYFENLNKKHRPESSDTPKNSVKKLGPDAIEKYNDRENWQNNELTTLVWEMISQNRLKDLFDLIASNPAVPHLRSEDGRGPMWWAHEYKRDKIVDFLKRLGVSEERKDVNGITPLSLTE